MKPITLILAFLFSVTAANAQQGNIFSIISDSDSSHAYFTRMDEATLQLDTIAEVDHIIGEWPNTMDLQNERFIFHVGLWQYSRICIVDLNTGHIDSIFNWHAQSFAEMKYDPYHNRLICRNTYIQRLTTFDLTTNVLDTLSLPLPSNDTGYGYGPLFLQAYDGVHERYLYIHKPDTSLGFYLSYIDLAGDSVISTVPIDTVPSLNYDESEDKYFGVAGDGLVGSIDPVSGAFTLIATIPDHAGNLDFQKVMYDGINNRIVAPYYSTIGENRIAFVDVTNGQMYITDTLPAMLELNHILGSSVIITDTLQSILKAPVAQSYQWYKNNTIISGANSQAYNVTASGDYYVELTFVNHTGKSNIIHYTALSVEANDPDIKVTISPNPFHQYTNLQFDYLRGLYSLSLMDQLGKLVRRIDNIASGTIRIDKNDLAQGVYYFELTNGDSSIKGKLLVQ